MGPFAYLMGIFTFNDLLYMIMSTLSKVDGFVKTICL